MLPQYQKGTCERDRIFKWTPIHASVNYQIPRFCWNPCIPSLFRLNTIGSIKRTDVPPPPKNFFWMFCFKYNQNVIFKMSHLHPCYTKITKQIQNNQSLTCQISRIKPSIFTKILNEFPTLFLFVHLVTSNQVEMTIYSVISEGNQKSSWIEVEHEWL